MKILQCLCAAALLGMTACTNSDQLGLDVNDVQDTPLLRLTASQRGLAGHVTTRAADNLYTPATGFYGTESVEVWFGTPHATYSVGTPDETTHKSVLSGGTLRYPEGTGTAGLYAVYPAASGTAGSHTVAYDQTDDNNYKASDLMFAKKAIYLSADKSVTQELTFDHQLIKLKMEVTKDDALPDITKIELKNLKRKVAFTTSADTLMQVSLSTPDDGKGDNLLVMDGTADPSAIISDTAPHSYCMLFPAQTWTSAIDFMVITFDNNGTEYTYTFTLDKSDWQNGSEYVLTLAVHDSYLGVKVNVNDWLTCGELTTVKDTGDTSGN